MQSSVQGSHGKLTTGDELRSRRHGKQCVGDSESWKTHTASPASPVPISITPDADRIGSFRGRVCDRIDWRKKNCHFIVMATDQPVKQGTVTDCRQSGEIQQVFVWGSASDTCHGCLMSVFPSPFISSRLCGWSQRAALHREAVAVAAACHAAEVTSE